MYPISIFLTVLGNTVATVMSFYFIDPQVVEEEEEAEVEEEEEKEEEEWEKEEEEKEEDEA